MNTLRRFASVAVILAVGAAVLTAAPPAGAAPNTVTWDGTTLSPSSLPQAAVGDTFSVANTTGSAVWVVDVTGRVLGGQATPCVQPASCVVLAASSNTPGSLDLQIDQLGDIAIVNPTSGFPVAALTLGPTAVAAPAPAPPTFQMTFNGNGATACSPASATGQSGDSYALPTASQCTRPGYTLVGWSASATATEPDNPNLAQPADANAGPTANFADSGTLFAVWKPRGIRVTYDANVGAGVPCIAGLVIPGAASSFQSAPAVVAVGSLTATSAPCDPGIQFGLKGWATTGRGETIVTPGGPLPASVLDGSTITLFAVWGKPCGPAYTFSGGVGSSDRPYLIASSNDVQCLHDRNQFWHTGLNFEQTADIDMGGVRWSSGIGRSSTDATMPSGFSGVYDGRDHDISNLSIRPMGKREAGLFASVNGEIRSIGFSGAVIGDEVAGGLAAYNNGTISGSHFDGSVSGGDVVGGLIGSNRGTVSKSFTTGSVTGRSTVGGLIGYSFSGEVVDSHSSATVVGKGHNLEAILAKYVGGLIGVSASSVEGSYATGDVSATGESAGGLVGLLAQTREPMTLTRCFATGDVAGTVAVGGLAGSSYFSVSESFATGNISGTSKVTATRPGRQVAEGVGGLIGESHGRISDSYATGAVRGFKTAVGGLVGHLHDYLERSFSTGMVNGVLATLGGLVGDGAKPLTSDSFWNTETSKMATSSGGEARSTSEMTSLGNYVQGGWSIRSNAKTSFTWGSCPKINGGYPFLTALNDAKC